MAEVGRKRATPLDNYVVAEPEDAVQIYKKPRTELTHSSGNVVTFNSGGRSLQEQLIDRAANWAFEKGTAALESWWNRPAKRAAEEQIVPAAPAKRVTTTTTTIIPRRSSAPARQVTRTVRMVPKTVRYTKKAARRYYKKQMKKTGTKARTYFGHTPSLQSRGKGEFKYIDTTPQNGATISNTASITYLDFIPLGDTVNSREGQRWVETKCRIRGTIRAGTSGTIANAVFMLVWDYEPRGTLATITEILVNGTVQALPNRDNQARFRILKRWVFTLAGNATAPAAGLETAYIDEYFKLPKGLEALTTKTDITGDISNRTNGALLWVVLSDQAAAGGVAPIATVQTRVNFRD